MSVNHAPRILPDSFVDLCELVCWLRGLQDRRIGRRQLWRLPAFKDHCRGNSLAGLMFVFLLPQEYQSRRADPDSGGRVLRLQSKMLAHGLLGNFQSIAGMFGMSMSSGNL